MQIIAVLDSLVSQQTINSRSTRNTELGIATQLYYTKKVKTQAVQTAYVVSYTHTEAVAVDG